MDIDVALSALKAGGVVVYPTETLYAVGCVATNDGACRRVTAIKGRPENKPLPLIIGWPEGLELVTDTVPDTVLRLADLFWPGPLSILVKAKLGLSPLVSDEQGYTSVRLSPHSLAAELSRRAKAPLVATSANMSGRPAAGVPEELDMGLLHRVDAACLEKPWPQGGEPSTVVKVVDSDTLEIVRPGAVAVAELKEQGFSVAIS